MNQSSGICLSYGFPSNPQKVPILFTRTLRHFQSICTMRPVFWRVSLASCTICIALLTNALRAPISTIGALRTHSPGAQHRPVLVNFTKAEPLHYPIGARLGEKNAASSVQERFPSKHPSRQGAKNSVSGLRWIAGAHGSGRFRRSQLTSATGRG